MPCSRNRIGNLIIVSISMVFLFIHKVYKVRRNMKEMEIKSISLTITDNKRHQENIDITSFLLVSDMAVLNVGEY